MTSFRRFGATASLMAVATAFASPAFAVGTTSGTSITNTVSVTYNVGGVAQSPLSASDSFTVDRKVNLTVTEVGSATTQVSPGQLAAVTTFDVANLSNATIDIALAASNLAGDNYDVSNFKYYVDTNANGSYDAGTDLQITYLDQLVADGVKRVFVVADIPLGQSTGQVANIRLSGTASEGTTAGSLGATITATAGANTAGVDTVLADSNANGNTASDGISFAQDSYTILTAALSAIKTSRIVSDPISGTTNPKAIPGAVLEYCIAVSNGGGADATSVAINDPLPGATTYEPTFGVKVNGTVTSGTCNADGGIAGSQASGTVTGTIPTITSGQTRTVLFRVTIQ
jgi:uncharacterized repeat protein (TIGR01451 family)